MDWTKDFIETFKNSKELKDLEKEKFFGNVQLNFYNGKVVAINKYQTIKIHG